MAIANIEMHTTGTRANLLHHYIAPVVPPLSCSPWGCALVYMGLRLIFWWLCPKNIFKKIISSSLISREKPKRTIFEGTLFPVLS